jgi:hypothetical protein
MEHKEGQVAQSGHMEEYLPKFPNNNCTINEDQEALIDPINEDQEALIDPITLEKSTPLHTM